MTKHTILPLDVALAVPMEVSALFGIAPHPMSVIPHELWHRRLVEKSKPPKADRKRK